MKIRKGFVSNSSSSSFCLLGTSVNEKKLISEELEEQFADEPYEVLEEKLRDTDLSYVRGLEEYYEDYVVGVSPNSLDPDKTIRQHKIEIAEKISKAFGKEISDSDIEFCIDGGHDG